MSRSGATTRLLTARTLPPTRPRSPAGSSAPAISPPCRWRRTILFMPTPPYDGAFTRYQAGGFSWADQVRLAEWLAAHPGPVLASNQATPRILSLYGQLGFTLWALPAPRRIACNGDRSPALEMLAARGALDLAASGGWVAGPADLQRVHPGSELGRAGERDPVSCIEKNWGGTPTTAPARRPNLVRAYLP